MSEAYENFYYERWLYAEFQKRNPPIESMSKNEKLEFTQTLYLNDAIGEDVDFDLSIENDKYKLTVTDKNGVVLETTTGEISSFAVGVNIGGKTVEVDNAVLVIDNFESDYYFASRFGKSFISDGAISSLIIYKSNGKYVVKDILSTTTNVANELEPEKQMQ